MKNVKNCVKNCLNINLRAENIMNTLKKLQKMQEELEKQAELMGEVEARLGLIENKQI